MMFSDRIVGAAIASAAMLAIGTVSSNAAVPITGGMTDVELTSAGALTTLGIAVSALGTATIESTSPYPTAVFPITGGSVGPGGALIEHDGSGLELSKAATTVDLQNFLIDTAGGGVDGLVTVDGSKVGVIPLFTLETPTGPNMIPLDLTQGAANALNSVFFPGSETPPFSSSTQIGVASVSPVLAPETSTWAMMLLGFAGLGFAAHRGGAKSRLAAAIA